MASGFLSNGEHIDDIMIRLYRKIDEALNTELINLTQDEKLRVYQDISLTFRDAEAL